MRYPEATDQEDGSLESWLAVQPDGAALAVTAARLRAAAGGAAGPGADAHQVAAYFVDGPRDPAALRRLIADPALRRDVAMIGRLLDPAEPMGDVARSPQRRPRRWVTGGALAIAAALGLVAVLPRTDTPPHRAATVAGDELRVVTAAGVQPAAPEIAWERVLTADLYEVEVTAADGRPVFTGQTAHTALRVPDSVLAPGVSYFFRVRARLEAGRWIASDFRELVVRP